MPTHTTTIRAIHRDPTRRDGIPCRLVTLDADPACVGSQLSA